LRLEGLHMHIGSGVDYAHLARVCVALVAVACRFPIDAAKPVSMRPTISDWNDARREVARHLGHAIRLEIEPGRYFLAEADILVCRGSCGQADA